MLVQEKYGQKQIPFVDYLALDKPIPELSNFNKKLKTALNYNPQTDSK